MVCGKKKRRGTDREINTAVYLLRALQVGLTLQDLECLDVGMVLDITTEAANDNENYTPMANQADFDRF